MNHESFENILYVSMGAAFVMVTSLVDCLVIHIEPFFRALAFSASPLHLPLVNFPKVLLKLPSIEEAVFVEI